MRRKKMQKKEIKVNGVPRIVIADPEASLADVLREQRGLTGTKVGCGTAHCGACSGSLHGDGPAGFPEI